MIAALGPALNWLMTCPMDMTVHQCGNEHRINCSSLGLMSVGQETALKNDISQCFLSRRERENTDNPSNEGAVSGTDKR